MEHRPAAAHGRVPQIQCDRFQGLLTEITLHVWAGQFLGRMCETLYCRPDLSGLISRFQYALSLSYADKIPAFGHRWRRFYLDEAPSD